MGNQDIHPTLHEWSSFLQRFIQKLISTLASAKMQIVVAMMGLSFYLAVTEREVQTIVDGQVVTHMAPYLSGAQLVALWSTIITAYLATRVAVPTISAIGDVINTVRGATVTDNNQGEEDGDRESAPPNPYA